MRWCRAVRKRLLSLAEPPRALDDEDIQFLNIERRRQHELDRMQKEHDNEELKEFFVCETRSDAARRGAVPSGAARCWHFRPLAYVLVAVYWDWEGEFEMFRCL